MASKQSVLVLGVLNAGGIDLKYLRTSPVWQDFRRAQAKAHQFVRAIEAVVDGYGRNVSCTWHPAECGAQGMHANP